MTTIAARTGTLLTGLVREPTFEQAIRFRNPNVKIPFREAWFERNSHHLSQFDGTHEDAQMSLVDHLRSQGDEANAHAAMQQHYRQQGIPYLAQGVGGPPPRIPPGGGAAMVAQDYNAHVWDAQRAFEEQLRPFDEAANIGTMGRHGPGDPPDAPEQRLALQGLDALRNRAFQMGAFMASRSDDLSRYQPSYGRWGVRDYAGNARRNVGLIGEALANSAQDSINFYRDAGSVVAQAARWGMHSLSSQLGRQPQLQPLLGQPSGPLRLGGPGPNPFRGLPDFSPQAHSNALAIDDERRDPQRAHQLALDDFVRDRQELYGDILGATPSQASSSSQPEVTRPMLIYPQRIRSDTEIRLGTQGHRDLAQFQANVEPAAQGSASFAPRRNMGPNVGAAVDRLEPVAGPRRNRGARNKSKT